jgi:hypothetical protein
VEFNLRYHTATTDKFDKYASRLGEPVPVPEDIQPPEAILAPYFVASDRSDPWWDLAQRLFAASVDAAETQGSTIPCLRVVAAHQPGNLAELLGDAADERAVVWVSGLDELHAVPTDLVAYGGAIAEAQQRGQQLFALYGGFFSVLLREVGLRGASHGIGFGEYRHWLELPQSGPPPARYYLRAAHRYVSQDLAYQLWEASRDVVACPCSACAGRSPIDLDYHALMKHSVFCRAAEIHDWAELDLAEAGQRLSAELGALEDAISSPRFPQALEQTAQRNIGHMPNWISAIERL